MIQVSINSLDQSRSNHQQILQSIYSYPSGQQFNQAPISKYGSGLGPWLYGYALARHPNIEAIYQAERLHAQIYDLLQECIDMCGQGDTNEARQKYAQINLLDERLQSLLANINLPQEPGDNQSADKVDDTLEERISFRAFTESTQTLILLTDLSGQIIYANGAWVTATGMSMVQLSLIGWGDAVHAEDIDSVEAGIVSALSGVDPPVQEIRMSGRNF